MGFLARPDNFLLKLAVNFQPENIYSSSKPGFKANSEVHHHREIKRAIVLHSGVVDS